MTTRSSLTIPKCPASRRTLTVTQMYSGNRANMIKSWGEGQLLLNPESTASLFHEIYAGAIAMNSAQRIPQECNKMWVSQSRDRTLGRLLEG